MSNATEIKQQVAKGKALVKLLAEKKRGKKKIAYQPPIFDRHYLAAKLS